MVEFGRRQAFEYYLIPRGEQNPFDAVQEFIDAHERFKNRPDLQKIIKSSMNNYIKRMGIDILKSQQ